MGCDIHFYVETKQDNDAWKTEQRFWTRWKYLNIAPAYYPEWYGDRSYALFARLAGVRGEGPPVKEPRGLPDDVSPVVAELHEIGGEDYHTRSWLTLAEILEHEDVVEMLEDTVDAMKALLPSVNNDPARVRAVFWFDS